MSLLAFFIFHVFWHLSSTFFSILNKQMSKVIPTIIFNTILKWKSWGILLCCGIYMYMIWPTFISPMPYHPISLSNLWYQTQSSAQKSKPKAICKEFYGPMLFSYSLWRCIINTKTPSNSTYGAHKIRLKGTQNMCVKRHICIEIIRLLWT